MLTQENSHFGTFHDVHVHVAHQKTKWKLKWNVHCTLQTHLVSIRSIAGWVFPAVIHEIHEPREGGFSIALIDQGPLPFDDGLVQLLGRCQALIGTLTSQKLKDEHSIWEDVNLYWKYAHVYASSQWMNYTLNSLYIHVQILAVWLPCLMHIYTMNGEI